jgi:hypothetical protein
MKISPLTRVGAQSLILVTMITSLLAFSSTSYGLSGNHVGLYGKAWVETALGPGHSSDVLIYQVSPGTDVDEVLRVIDRANSADVKIVLDIQFYKDYPQRSAAPSGAPLSPVPTYEQAFARVLDRLGERKVEGVTIEEENVWWAGRPKFLTDLYRGLKKRYPTVNFYQWYTSSKKVHVPGEEAPLVPSDGWVIDEYALTGENYEKFAQGMVRLGKPVVSIVWASPNWKVGHGDRTRDAAWWNEEGWKIFYWQVAVNKTHGFATTFFVYGLKSTTEPDGRAAIESLSNSKEKCSTDFRDALLNTTIPHIKTASIPRTVPATRPSWIPGYCQ